MLAVVPGREEEARTNIRAVCAQYSAQTGAGQTGGGAGPAGASTPASPYKAGWIAQFRALMWRSWLSVIKEPLIMRVRIIQTIMIALILGAVYFGQELTAEGVMSINGAIFLFITSSTFSNMFAVINVICAELPIFLREHHNGMYRTDTYFLTKQVKLSYSALFAQHI